MQSATLLNSGLRLSDRVTVFVGIASQSAAARAVVWEVRPVACGVRDVSTTSSLRRATHC
jgi:hypothetical protein